MKRCIIIMFVFACLWPLLAQSEATSADFSLQALRVEIYLSGDAQGQAVTVGEIILDPRWGGQLARPVSTFNQGAYVVSLFAADSNRLLFKQGFDCLFAEYQTTEPALKGISKTFQHSLVLPCPQKICKLVLERRDRKQNLHKLLERVIDPGDYHIISRSPIPETVFTLQQNGDPAQKVDLLFLAEGYTKDEQEKFKTDAERFQEILFTTAPYKQHRQDFNINALFCPSGESGVDEPRERIYRDTALDASFNALDLDRYMLTQAGHKMRRLAGALPYDVLVILVNSKRYGGGGIYNDYCITTVDHERSPSVFLHELGHTFAGLADEYYSSDVSYTDFFPKGLEPLEPNITALLKPQALKWQHLMTPGIALPTPWGKAEREALQEQRRQLRNTPPGKDKDKTLKKLDKKLKAIESKYLAVEAQVGAFEGAGYSSTGLYRPMIHCLMISSPKREFCRVCQEAISQTIAYQCGRF